MPAKVYVLCRFAARSGLYQPWLDQIDSVPVQVVDQPIHRWQPPEDAGLIVTHLHYHWEALHALRNIYQAGKIPILILADGILEYRNTFLHPGLPAGSIFHPLFGHKLACLGRAPARLIESWGNAGRCEVIGLPRLDQVQRLARRSSHEKFRILVASATTPAFDDDQQRIVAGSLIALRNWSAGRTLSDGRELELVWRVSPQLATELGVAQEDESERPELDSVMAETDAVITTPSTLFLESALRGRPTALLDFFHHPSFVPAAWTLRCREQFGQVISELAEPPAAKLEHQEFILHDQLECRTPATPRMEQLIKAMLEAGTQAAQTNAPLQLPHRIVPFMPEVTDTASHSDNLAQLYPDNDAFEIKDRQRLQIELTAAIERLQQLPDELDQRDEYIDQLHQKNDQLKVRVRELHARVQSLRQRLGIDQQPGSPGEKSDD